MKRPIEYYPGMPFPALQRSDADGGIEYVTECPVWVAGFLIPQGFVFDGNSAPRCLFWLIARDDCLAAACVHDYIYRGPGQRLLLLAGCRAKCLRISADTLWMYLQVSHGIAAWRVSIGYRGLRLFGAKNFRPLPPQPKALPCTP